MTQFNIVNIVPQTHSNETWQDAEPSIGVNQADPTQIVISAFTPPDPGQTNGPVYYSQDGGATWNLSFIVPGGEANDQTFKFSSRSGQFYGGDLAPGSVTLNALTTADPFIAGTMTVDETNANDDQPFIEVTTVPFGPDTGKDRVYLGHNDTSVSTGSGGTGQTAAIDVCLDATLPNPVYTRYHLDPRSTSGQDGPTVRTAVNTDGTIYAAYVGWRTGGPGNLTVDIVVARDDSWASGASPFTALTEPPAPNGDGLAGVRVQQNVALFFDALGGQPGHQNAGALGQERVGGSLSIAVHPSNSDIVVICWAGIISGAYTLNVQRSTNRGVTWSAPGLTIPNATNPALAIASTGRIGLLYQQLSGTAPNQTWDTHFRDSLNATTWNDTLLATTPANQPVLNASQGRTYIGDYIDMVAVGKNFYGAFCANNTPNPANFPATPATAATPNGAVFLRNVTTSAPWNLLGTDGSTVVSASIDPFFVQAIEVPAYSDFYVRDWTDSATSADTGLEPSTHADFYSTSDVWNQVASSPPAPNPPNANDQPMGDNAQAGATNYAFANIRRNAAAAAGSAPVNASAHFLVSEFGTGSNFVDWMFSDPTDPDITFPSPADVSVTFNPADLLQVTPPFPWALGTTTSDHLCLAVEISAPGDPALAPSLAGRAPGPAGTDPSVVQDNHKAQRNLQVSTASGGSNGSVHYGIVHNGWLQTRDVIIGLLAPTGRVIVPKGTTVEIVTEAGSIERRPWQTWDQLVLPGMTPGENRWIGVTLPVGTVASGVDLAELKGDSPLNGFALVVSPAPVTEVITSTLAWHDTILARLRDGFDVGPQGGGTQEPGGKHHEGLDFHERVHVAAEHVTIQVEVRVTGADRVETEPPEPPGSQAGYACFVRSQVAVLTECLGQLGGTDPFEIAAAIAALSAAPTGDVTALLTAHATVLAKFDAFLTMLQKAQGDRADILQMVRWHDGLCGSPALAALPQTAAIQAQLGAFVQSVTDRTMTVAGYLALLAALAPALTQTGTDLGQSALLGPLVSAMAAAPNARVAEGAHRSFLLALQSLL